jgi:hypothetical protein
LLSNEDKILTGNPKQLNGRIFYPKHSASDLLDYVISEFSVLSLEQNLGTITWTFTTAAPSGTETKKYRWYRLGNLVIFQYRIEYQTQGTAVTGYSFPLPSDCPSPWEFAGVAANNEVLIAGYSHVSAANSTISGVGRCALKRNADSSGYVVLGTNGSINTEVVSGTIEYLTV